MTAKTGVIFLLKDRFQLFSPYLRSVVEFRFTPEMVLDLDVLNDELLQQQIKVFVTNGKIPPSNLIIVLNDNAYFVKDFALRPQPVVQPQKPGQPAPPAPKVSLADLQPQIDLFVEHVPYENIVSKTFPLKNGVRVCAVNQDLYRAVQDGFEKLGFTVESVFPGMVLGGGLSAKPVLDGPITSITLQKAQSLKQFDLKSQAIFTPIKKKDDEQIDEVELEMANSKEPPKTNKKRMIAMVGVLAVLLVVLVIVFIQSQQPPPPPPAQPVLAPQPTVMPPVATPTELNDSEKITAAQTRNLTAKIVYSSEAATIAQSLRSSMNTYTFKSVTLQLQNSASSATTVVSFSATTPQAVRNAVLDEVQKVKTNITVQESQQGTNDISILIAK